MTLSAGGFYALRCATLTLGTMSIAIGAPLWALDLTVGFAFGMALGLFAFYGDYRARRGSRTTIGTITRRGLAAFGVGVAILALAVGFHGLLDALFAGRPVGLGVFRAVPFALLFLTSFYDRLADWPWSDPKRATSGSPREAG